MKSGRMARRLAATAGMGAIIAMGALTACGQGEKAPETTTPTTTTTTTTTTAAPPRAAVAPTEKSINPTGGNLFTPPVKAPPAPTAPSLATTKPPRLVDQVQIAAAVTALPCRRSRTTPHGRWPCSAPTA